MCVYVSSFRNLTSLQEAFLIIMAQAFRLVTSLSICSGMTCVQISNGHLIKPLEFPTPGPYFNHKVERYPTIMSTQSLWVTDGRAESVSFIEGILILIKNLLTIIHIKLGQGLLPDSPVVLALGQRLLSDSTMVVILGHLASQGYQYWVRECSLTQQ